MNHVLAPRSWLFVKGDQSIRIVRPEGRSLIVQGPDTTRQRQEFRDERTLEAYQVSMAERLAEHGWVLYGIDSDRRIRERRVRRRESIERRV